MPSDLERLVVRHRHVAPMLSALLAGTNATIVLRDPDGTVVLHREGRAAGETVSGPFPIAAEGRVIGTVEGGPFARPIAAVLSYAVARELDKRALAREALDRYRELNLIYDLAGTIGTTLEVGPIATAALAEIDRLPAGGHGFLFLLDDATGRLDRPEGSPAVQALPNGRLGAGIAGSVAAARAAELVNVPAGDPRATPEERSYTALACAPLVAGDRLIGVLGATTRTPGGFRAGDLKLVEAIAALAAPALEGARRRAVATPGTMAPDEQPPGTL
jgi:hypothetical protein